MPGSIFSSSGQVVKMHGDGVCSKATNMVNIVSRKTEVQKQLWFDSLSFTPGTWAKHQRI